MKGRAGQPVKIEAVYSKILSGFAAATKVVASTSSFSKSTCLYSSGGKLWTNDRERVLDDLSFRDRFQNLGARSAIDAASAMRAATGLEPSLACSLALGALKTGIKLMNITHSRSEVVAGLTGLNEIEVEKYYVDSDDAALASSRWWQSKLVSQASKECFRDGSVKIEADAAGSSVEHDDKYRFRAGIVSAEGSPLRSNFDVKGARVVVVDGSFPVDLYLQALDSKLPVIFFCTTCDPEVKKHFANSSMSDEVNSICFELGQGRGGFETLQDIAAAAGASLISYSYAQDWSINEHSGICQTVGKGEREVWLQPDRANQSLRERLALLGRRTSNDRTKWQDRYHSLSGNTTVVKVAAAEPGWTQEAVYEACHASKSFYANGASTHRLIWLPRAIGKLSRRPIQDVGLKMLKGSLVEALESTIAAAGLETTAMALVSEADSYDEGYGRDPLTHEVVNALKSSCLEPYELIRESSKIAASIARGLLSSEYTLEFSGGSK